MLEILPKLVDGFTSNLVAYAVLLAAIATITMALLELVKALPIVSARLRYHQHQVRKWVGPDTYRELLVLAVASVDSADALFDQPTDKMMGQIQAASNVALDFPDLYPNLYAFLTRTPESRGAEKETGVGTTPGESDDATRWREYSRTLDRDRTTDELPPGAQAAMRARARLDHFMTRKLDAFQTRAEYFWARGNQYVAFVACAIFVYVILTSVPGLTVVQRILLASAGGMVAPFAKDIVSALSGLRAKTG